MSALNLLTELRPSAAPRTDWIIFSFLLQSFAGHLQVVVPLGFRQLDKIHQAGVLPLVVITDLRAKQWLQCLRMSEQ